MDEKMIACYSMEEQKLILGLDELFVEWERLFEKWDNPNEMFVRDGFILGYLKSKKKILFIGRDSYDVWDDEVQAVYSIDVETSSDIESKIQEFV